MSSFRNFPSRCHVLVLLSLAWLGFIGIAQADAPPEFFIEGYTGQTSYAPGEEVSFHVSMAAAVPKFTLSIARLGQAAEAVWKTDAPVAGATYPIPEEASSQGCGWPVALKVKIPEAWRSGYYEAVFQIVDGGGKFSHRNQRTAQSSCYFIVRSAQTGAQAKILLQLATNTYNAYNNWGGSSVYAYHGRGKLQGYRVSENRPPASQFAKWEWPFVKWAERQGYRLDYAANSDLEFHPEILEHYQLVLSVGHDEYWSAPMRDHLEAFIGKSGNVAFFGGNTCCWQIRSEDAGRAFTCHKQYYLVDPVYATKDFKRLSSLWSHHLVKRPENTLTGVGFLWGGYHLSHGQLMDGTGGYTVHQPEHWVFAGTDLPRGATLGSKASSIVGYECDGCELTWRDGVPFPTHRDGTPESFVVLGSAPARWAPDDCEWYEQWEQGRQGAACMGIYTRGGTVFTAGSTDWAHGLTGADPAVERITKNLLDRLATKQ